MSSCDGYVIYDSYNRKGRGTKKRKEETFSYYLCYTKILVSSYETANYRGPSAPPLWINYIESII